MCIERPHLEVDTRSGITIDATDEDCIVEPPS